ncbi:MAG: glycogen synthase GlgA [Terriglobia bacterium]
MKILFVASEAVPFAKTGGLADVMGALPKNVRQLGHETAVIMPRYRGILTKRILVPSMTVSLGGETRFCSIQEAEPIEGVRFFFVDHGEFYNRENLYLSEHQDYPDNAERFAFLCLATLEFLKRAPIAPDIIHCNDWQTALLPVYLKTLYQTDLYFQHTKTLLTIHNMAYQGVFPRAALPKISLPASLYSPELLEFYGNICLLKGGILFADKLSTVSRRYSEEILTPHYGHGLEGVLRKRASDLTGILNGVDYSDWNPSNDPHLAAPFSPENLDGKRLCKIDLLEQFGIPESIHRPVIGIVSRLAYQKGLDLLFNVGDDLIREGCSLVVIGTGEQKYARYFLALQERYPSYVGVKIMYDEALAHKIEAGADMFLMPSRYEPCGLNQIYSLKYGTVPLVRATGGLDDTIIDVDDSPKPTGFKFSGLTPADLLHTVRRALAVYATPARWQQLMKNGMGKDYSWHQSARKYEELYKSLLSHS